MPGNNGEQHVFNDEYWMALAIEEARQAELIDEVPVGAIIVYNDKIIGRGYNQLINKNDATAHAEILAIRSAGQAIKNYRLVTSKLYVTLEPCMMCVGAMVHARIDSIIFGAYDHKTGMAGTKEDCFNKPYHNHKIKIKGGILELDCARLLKDFFRKKRKKG